MAINPKIQASIPSTANISRVELDNGIVILAYENSAVQSVNIMGSIHAGSIYESVDKNGLSGFITAAVMHGTKTRDFDAIHSALEDIGADLNYNSHTHKIGFSGKSLAEDLPTLMDVLKDTLRNPTFPTEQMERLRGERLTWLQYSQFNTRYRAATAMREALYSADHPYYYSAYGTETTIPGLTIEDMKQFHAKHYGPKGMIFVVVGAVKAGDVISMISEQFGDWQNPDQPPIAELPEFVPNETEKRVFAFVAGKSQSDISMGIAGPSRYAPDYVAAQLANSILGEFGMMGRIGKSVREEKGLAYYAYSRVGGGHGPEAWTISAGVNPDNVELAIDSSLEEIERLITEEVSDDDLADNQSYFVGRLPLRLESNEGLSSHIHGMESFNLGLDYLANYRDMIYQFNKADLLSASQNYLKTDRMVIAVAGPEYVNYQPVPLEKVRSLRQSVLRPGKPAEKSVYPLDDAEDSLHLGAFKNTELVGSSTLLRQSPPNQDLPNAWRLRGVATVDTVRGEGHGKELIKMVMEYIAYQGGGTLWCHAKLEAKGFYEKLGFTAEGEPFNVEGDGMNIFLWREVEAQQD